MTPKPHDRARPPAQWVKYLERAGVLGDALTRANGDRAKAIATGKYLSAKVGRTIPICINDRTGTATLRFGEARAHEKRYWFEVVWNRDQPSETNPTPPMPPNIATLTKQQVGSSPNAPTPAEPLPTASSVVREGNGEEWN
jgi:hypothetical protein